MLSLENSYNEEDLIDWDRKAREVAKKELLEYCALNQSLMVQVFH
jgi:DNA ligase (NAD+)